ncbi:hypothetical protein IWX90DRAFT_278057 [Phyllosticta citrichinensis]|uniref:WSC domain-containing protein n=1 Tax=Phyllosticta citrichinensis TaxID=1130410 RepID=A0ABR1XNB2_9PEZI
MGPKLCSWQDVFQRLLLLALFLGQARGLSQTYCSGQNTGASNFQDTFTFQSNGHCYNECKEKFAFAIVQGKNCWCSNYAPSDQEDPTKCDTTCPGYGYENCGNSDDNLYGYIRADTPISGTVAASTAAKTSDQSSATFVPPTTRVDTKTVAVDHTVSKLITVIPSPSFTSTSTTPSSTQTSESSGESTSSAATTESSAKSESTLSTSVKFSSAVTSVTVVTQGGNVITQTVTSVPGANSTSAGSRPASKNSVSGGQVAGAVVGGLAGVALIVGIATWILLRRRNAQNAGRDENGDGNHPPQRNVSTLSRTGLLKSAERDYSTTLPPINTRHSSNDPSGTETMTPMSERDRRNSRPVFLDPRLNPYPYHVDNNNSHISIVSIEDNRDYTRTLNVRNPDPPGRDSNDTRDKWEQR